MDANDLNHLTPEVQAYIRALEAQNRQLAERIQILEELFRLSQLKRFAPRHNVLDLLYLKRRGLSLRLRRTEGSEPQLRRADREAV
jgi:hypothetical protein